VSMTADSATAAAPKVIVDARALPRCGRGRVMPRRACAMTGPIAAQPRRPAIAIKAMAIDDAKWANSVIPRVWAAARVNRNRAPDHAAWSVRRRAASPARRRRFTWMCRRDVANVPPPIDAHSNSRNAAQSTSWSFGARVKRRGVRPRRRRATANPPVFGEPLPGKCATQPRSGRARDPSGARSDLTANE
jgi:hypothetical protein